MVRDSRDLHRPWTYPPERADQFDDLVSRTVRDDFACLAAVLADDGELVGIFTVSQIVRGYFQSAYLGYYANARHAGKGLMSEAMALVLDHAFGPLSLHRLEANIQPGNAPVDRAGPRRGLPAGGLLAALPADRRPLARPRALRDHRRRARGRTAAPTRGTRTRPSCVVARAARLRRRRPRRLGGHLAARARPARRLGLGLGLRRARAARAARGCGRSPPQDLEHRRRVERRRRVVERVQPHGARPDPRGPRRARAAA